MPKTTENKTSQLILHSMLNNSYEIQSVDHQGRKHIVVPVIMMVPGVHNGSRGAVLHTEEQLGFLTEAWNGIPIVINHPEDEHGFISANSPGVIDSQSVGRIYNTRYENGLRADAYLDEEKLKAVSPETLEYITHQYPLDVSVGVFTEDEPSQGLWHNEEYNMIATNYRPDHLALLPGGTGACSWNDGCGIRVNQKQNKGGGNEMLVKVNKKNNEEVSVALAVNQPGYRSIIQNIQSLLDGMDNDMKTHYLQELYEDHVIYEVRRQGSTNLYKQDYSVHADDVVELMDDPVEVRKQVSYIAMTEYSMKRNKFSNNKKGDNKMPKENTGTPCCEETVNVLIANKATRFSEDDREWLLAQNEATLSKLFPKEQKQTEPVQVNKEQVMQVLKESISKPEDFVNFMPAEYRDQMTSALSLHKAKKQEMIQKIMDNSDEGTWNKDELDKMDMTMLSKLSSYIKAPVADYSLNGDPPKLQANEEFLVLPGQKVA